MQLRPVTILIDSYVCSACQTCVELCPDIFQLSKLTGKAELIDPEQPLTTCVSKAVAFCPVNCIVVEE